MVCLKRNSLIWVKILNGTHDSGFPQQSLNARFSCWHKFAIDTNISCIHSYIWEYVAMRKRYMETSFISLIKSCLNGQETRLCSISYTWSRMSMSFSSFSCSNKVKTPYQSAISALLQLGHEVTPKFRENNLLCITCFRTNFEKNNNYEKLLPYFTFLVLVQNILNLLLTDILESDLTFVALLGNVLFNLPFSNFRYIALGS